MVVGYYLCEDPNEIVKTVFLLVGYLDCQFSVSLLCQSVCHIFLELKVKGTASGDVLKAL